MRLALFLTLFLMAAPAHAFESTVLESVVSVLPQWPAERSAPRDEPEATAVAVAPGGYLATAYHVVAPAESIDVRLASGRIEAARLVGGDEETDVAVLKIESDLPVLPPAPEPSLGAPVCAVGNAFGLDLSITCGVVSALYRSNVGFNPIEDFVQTDAAVNPGMSGGALVDERGRLVGMLAGIFTKDSDANIGVNFAVSQRLLRRVVEDLVAYGEVRRGRAGLRVVDLDREEARRQTGARVVYVEPDGAAEQAGIQVDDILVEIANRPVRRARDVIAALHMHRPGESFYVNVRRGTMLRSVTVTLRGE